jgi:hypothetical protein
MVDFMNEVPKKIWVEINLDCSGDLDLFFSIKGYGEKYIRADLVDGLVEALKTCRFSGYTDIDGDYITTQHFDNTKVKAALKALEEWNGN